MGEQLQVTFKGIGILSALFAVVFLFTSCEMIGDLFGKENPSTEPPNGGGNSGRFRVSLSTVDATGSTDGVAAQACQSDFGSGYDVAAWEDIKRMYAATPSGDRSNFITNSLGLSIGGNGFLVKRSNSEIYSGRRHYFIDYHNGSVPGHYLQHDKFFCTDSGIS